VRDPLQHDGGKGITMKMLVVIEVDVSETVVETMRRNGFQVCQDGSGMQIKIPNTPTIPKRKTKIEFVSSPIKLLSNIMEFLRTPSDGHIQKAAAAE